MTNLKDNQLRGIIYNFLIRKVYTIVEELEQQDIDTIQDIHNIEEDLEESYFSKALCNCNGWDGFIALFHKYSKDKYLSKNYGEVRNMYYEELLNEIKRGKRSKSKISDDLECMPYDVGVEINDLM